MAEFLGFKNEDSYLESDLEAAIISHIRDFIMEMEEDLHLLHVSSTLSQKRRIII